MKTFRLLLAIAMTSIFGTVTLTGSAAPTQSAAAGKSKAQTGTLSVVVPALGSETFLPRLNTAAERVVNLAWGETLIHLNSKTRQYDAALATKWSNSKRGDDWIWTFKLRPGVKFNEGKGTVTAGDVKFMFRQCLRPDSINSVCTVMKQAIDADIKNFRANGPYAFSLHSSKATPHLPLFLSDGAGSVMPIMASSYYSKVGDTGFAAHPIGAGPFTFDSQVRAQSVTLQAVAQHYRTTPGYQTLKVLVAREGATRLAMVKSGAADLGEIDIGLKPQILSSGLKLWRATSYGQAFVSLGGMYYDMPDKNCDSCPWVGYNDNAKRVREALALAIDRKSMLQKLYLAEGALSAVPYSFTPGGYSYYDKKWIPPAYDPARAKALLSQAGYPNGFTIKMADISAFPSLTSLPNITELVVQYWSDIGVRVVREAIPWLSWRAKMVSRDTTGYAFPLFILVTNDPVGDLERNFSKAGALSYLDDPQFDKTITQGNTTFGLAKRAALAKSLGQYMINNRIGIPLFSLNQLFATTPRVKGWSPLLGAQGVSNPETITLTQ
jgi:peptide/nickel transport system substrate-binding protein